jgi:hypothetical protein
LQLEKEASQMTKIEGGRWMDLRPLPWNAQRSIRINLDAHSNEIHVSDTQERKYDVQITSTGNESQAREILSEVEQAVRRIIMPLTTLSRR